MPAWEAPTGAVQEGGGIHRAGTLDDMLERHIQHTTPDQRGDPAAQQQHVAAAQEHHSDHQSEGRHHRGRAQPADGPVHRAGVEEWPVESGCQAAADAAFARGNRAVDRNRGTRGAALNRCSIPPGTRHRSARRTRLARR